MLLVKCQERIGSRLDGDGDVEKIHPADGHRESVLGAEFTGGADGVAPVEFSVRPVAEADFLFDDADLLARVAGINGPCALQLPEGIEHLDAVPRRPNHSRLRMPVEQGDRRIVVRIAP